MQIPQPLRGKVCCLDQIYADNLGCMALTARNIKKYFYPEEGASKKTLKI
jgi:hypothetical protein